MSAVLRWIAVACLVLCMGCASASRTERLEFQLQRKDTELQACNAALADERARAAALHAEVRNVRQAHEAERALAANLREQVATLEDSQQQIRRRLEENLTAAPQRPEVAASPLPGALDGALVAFAEKYSQRVRYARQRGALTFLNDELFASGSDEVAARAYASLHELAELLSAHLPEEFELVVVGHTDDVPIREGDTRERHPTNWHLAAHRAIAVKDVLTQAGFPAKRLGVMAYGPERPASDSRVQNRRVELFVVPKGAVRNFAPVGRKAK